MVRGPEWRLPLSTHGHGRGGAQSAHRAGGGESSVQHRRRRSRHESLVASYRRSTRCFRPGEPVGRGSGKTSQRAWLLSPSCALWATGRKTDRVGPLSGKDAPAQREAGRAEQAGVGQKVGKPAVWGPSCLSLPTSQITNQKEELCLVVFCMHTFCPFAACCPFSPNSHRRPARQPRCRRW